MGQLVANLIKQLLRNEFSPLPAVMDAYTQHKKHISQPSLSDLVKMFHAVAATYRDGIFVVFDVLDDWQMTNNVHSKLIETHLHLQSRGTKINLLTTSHPMPNIAEAYDWHSFNKIVAQKDDIKRYMRNQMTNWHSVSDNLDLRHKIISNVASVADGM